ncbi:KDM8 [Symbiodinium natans]|uniref:KDM8 protein n=1 Tax=Symbiodinium natans TaxID=878477 RepID=A0A812SBI5_9DINO|nr:KDM8 [Symbiodinium natans]
MSQQLRRYHFGTVYREAPSSELYAQSQFGHPREVSSAVVQFLWQPYAALEADQELVTALLWRNLLRARRRDQQQHPGVMYRFHASDVCEHVSSQGATDFGGGSADLPGHGRPMQEVGLKQPVEVLTEVPDWKSFYQNYVRANRPVVFQNAARTQRAFDKWTDDYLVDLWGKEKIIDIEMKKVEERGGPTVQWPFEKFVREIYKDKRLDELYAVIGLEDEPEALADLDLPHPARCQEVWPQSVTLWMSSGGTMSVLHNDDGENFLMLVDGYKSVMLVHQDEAPNMYAHVAKVRGTSPVRQDAVDLVNFPRFANITWLHGEIGPGDMLFIPHTYWHQVNSRGRNLGVNMWKLGFTAVCCALHVEHRSMRGDFPCGCCCCLGEGEWSVTAMWNYDFRWLLLS